MAEESNLSVKAYYTGADGREEIRRFGVPETASTNYLYLVQRVQNVFGLGSQGIAVSWQDSDGDNITISSDEELFEAIRECVTKDQPLLRIFVTANGKQNTGSSSEWAEDVHEGVICDGCDGSISGIRYKCIVCQDYDLCSKCKDKGIHSQHNMISIHKDSKGTKTEFANEDGSFHFNMKTDLGGNTFGWTNGANPQQGWRCGRGGNKGHRRRSFGKNARGYHHQPPPPPHHFTFPGANPFESQRESGQQCPWSTSFDFRMPQSSSAFSEEANRAARSTADEATRFLSQVVKDIWTAWSGATNPPPTNGTASAQDESPQEASSSKECGEPSKEDSSVSSKTSASAEENTKEDDVIIEEPKAAASVGSCPQRDNTQSPEIMEISSPDAPETTPQHAPRMETDEWTLLNKESPSKDTPNHDSPIATPPSSFEVNYPNLSQFEPTQASSLRQSGASSLQNQAAAQQNESEAAPLPTHPNPRVQVALRQMLAMGYSNEGGWLTKLLEMKNGNINEILDLLMPANKRI